MRAAVQRKARSRRERLAAGLLGFVLAALCPTGAFAGPAAIERSRFLMGTVCEIKAVGVDESAIDRAFREIARIEAMISTWRPDSELSKLNESGRAVVAPELFELLRESVSLGSRTDRAFDPLIGPLVDLWKVREDGAFPTDEQIASTLPALALANVQFDGPAGTVSLSNGARFEEGGFGKGYAIDHAAMILRDAGATSYVINLGGQLYVQDKAGVEVSIANPEQRMRPAVTLRLSSGSLSTSSGSEKVFVTTRGTFCHILDPRSGRALPPRGSVSVIHQNAMTADALSTALYVLGPEDGLRWANANGISTVYLVPSSGGWDVLASENATQHGFGLASADAAFHLGGNRTR